MNNNEHEDKIIEDKTKEAYDLISDITKRAYNDIFLLSNQVLSKNPFTNNFLRRFLNNENLKSHSTHIILKLLKYYVNNIIDFVWYLFKFIEYYLSSLCFKISHSNRELILIDTFFLVSKDNKINNYTDPYFPGLDDLLKKMKKHYSYLPVFYSKNRYFSLYGVLKKIKREKIPMLCEFQLLSIFDLFYILYFIIVYPFHVLKFSRTLPTQNYSMNLFKYELIDTLHQVTFHSFSRYLQGRRIAKLPYEKIKVISWYENQVIDKNLYRGLRTGTNKAKIYGAQLFLYSKNILNIIPDENEEVFGVIPDRIVVNGPNFVPEKSRLNYVVGPSLRYSKVFNIVLKKENQKNILVSLPYFTEDARNIMQLLFATREFSRPVFIKPHPDICIDSFRDLLMPNFFITEEDIYSLFKISKILISAASGTLIEAISLGIPAISVKNTKRFEYNPLPEYGKGIVWEEVGNSKDLKLSIDKFEHELSNNPGKFYSIANMYKKKFFCEPSKENIIKAFDL